MGDVPTLDQTARISSKTAAMTANSRNLDLNSLECFDMLMREGSVSRASDRLGISQSSASDALARLRDRFADPLLVRTREGMTPTPRAAALLPQVRMAMSQLRSLLEAQGEFEPVNCTEHLRITASDFAQLLLMPTLTRTVQKEAPNSAIDVLPVNILRLEQALEAGDVDLAVAFTPEPPSGLRRSPLFEDHQVGIARQNHDGVGQGLTAEGFAAMSHISVAPSGLSYFSSVIDSALEALGLRRRIAVSSPHFLLAAHLVSQTDLVLAMPYQAARAIQSFLPLQIFEIPMTLRAIDLSMYWHERTHHSNVHRWLRDQIQLASSPYRAASPRD